MAIGGQFWAETERGEVCILVDDYVTKVIAYADCDEITPGQLLGALAEKYPDVAFKSVEDVSPGKIHAMGKRQL